MPIGKLPEVKRKKQYVKKEVVDLLDFELVVRELGVNVDHKKHKAEWKGQQ